MKQVGRIVMGLFVGAVASAVALFAIALALVVGGFRGNAALPADCAVVFGAAVSGYAQPGPAIVRRIATAARLYREGMVKTLIVTGGVGRGVGMSLSEATVMRAQAIAAGVHANDIRMEGESHSTWENLMYTKPLTSSCQSTVGISDAYHLTRIRLLAFRQGWKDFTVVPADETSPLSSQLQSVVREVFGLLYYGLYIDHVITL